MMRLLLSISLLILSGCGITPRVEVMPEDPFYSPVMPEPPEEKLVENGSLFNVSKINSLYADKKAHQIGDIIRVELRENTSATKTSNTDTSKENKLNLDPITAMGATNNVTINGNPISLGVNSKNEFAGEASANQSNFLIGSISVNVTEVLPNGNLMIRGEKWLRLNNGDEYIRLTGIVRPQDVLSNNTIPSDRIANARIQYSGTGAFADTQYQGWFASFFNGKWWPF